MVLDTTRGGEEELRAARIPKAGAESWIISERVPMMAPCWHVFPRESLFFAPWYWGLSARGRAVPPRWASTPR